MAETSPLGIKFIPALIDMLTEDLKETGAHLRDTDKKVTFVVQLYGGFLFVLATVTGTLIQAKAWTLPDLADPPGIAMAVMVSAFTWWIYLYTLRGLETKATYIARMNFLRRVIHHFLQTPLSDMAGFWTDVIQGGTGGRDESGFGAPRRIGLDELYPRGLQAIFVVAAAAAALLVARLAMPYVLAMLDASLWQIVQVTLLLTMTAIVGGVAFALAEAKWESAQDHIRDHRQLYQAGPQRINEAPHNAEGEP